MPRPIFYEPHPVSPERKAELLDKGYKIVDKRFEPENSESPADEIQEELSSIDKMKKPDVIESLEENSIPFVVSAKVDDLRLALKKGLKEKVKKDG